MDSSSVLVLGSYADKEFIKKLFNIGLSPLVRESIQASIYKLRHQQFAGILVDRNSTRAHVLEFVLNVRDIDRDIPIVISGPEDDRVLDKALVMLNNTIVLE